MRKKKTPVMGKQYITIYVNGEFLQVKKLRPELAQADNGKVYVYSKLDSKWHLYSVPKKGVSVTDDKSKLGELETEGDTTYQWQLIEGFIQRVPVQHASRFVSLSYVRNSGTKARTPGR